MTIKFLQAVSFAVPLSPTSGGTGVNNGSFTLSLGGSTTISNGGIIVLGGFTVTILESAAAVLNDNTATAGHVGFFSNAYKLNNDASLFWDNTNKRLGIGNAAPSRPLHVTGTGRFTTGLELNWLNDAAVPYLNASTKLLDSSASFTYNSADVTLGIGGTSTVAAKPRLAIKGADSDGVTGPHFQTNTSADIYPLMHFLSYVHDNVSISFDSYYDGAAVTWKSSDAGSNFQIRKNADRLGFWYEGGVAQGSNITWAEAASFDISGNFRLSGNYISRKNSTDYTGYIFHPLTSPLTSTSFDGDAFSTTAKTIIDLSAVFGVPAGVKAVLVTLQVRDSGSAATDCVLVLGPTNTANQGMITTPMTVNDRLNRATVVVPCDANGDIYYQVGASAASTFDIFMQIWGYWI